MDCRVDSFSTPAMTADPPAPACRLPSTQLVLEGCCADAPWCQRLLRYDLGVQHRVEVLDEGIGIAEVPSCCEVVDELSDPQTRRLANFT
jgi:hypothetical protein